MMHTLAVENYRSLRNIVLPLRGLNVIQGPNGSGKSNLYKSLRLLADTATGGIVSSLAREGGLQSTFWAGPERLSRDMQTGRVPVQGTLRQEPVRLKLGFAGEDFGYCITMGLPPDDGSAFSLDPEIKHECIWMGPICKASSILLARNGASARLRTEAGWRTITDGLNAYESVFTQIADPTNLPEVWLLRERIRGWRFYDQLRTDTDAPCRVPRLGTRTPVLGHDGSDLAAAIQTIREEGGNSAIAAAVEMAFPGASVEIGRLPDGRFEVGFKQPGLLRPLKSSELSDGTLRFLLLLAALLTPRPPSMMILNEPETSLHPDLLPALAQLILKASEKTQTWVVTHSPALVSALKLDAESQLIELEKKFGQTGIIGQSALDRPQWRWGE